MAENAADNPLPPPRNTAFLGLALAFLAGTALGSLWRPERPAPGRHFREIPQARVTDRYAAEEGILPRADYETEDLTFGVTRILGAIVVITLATILTLILLLYPQSRDDQAVKGDYRLETLETPRLQTDPRGDMTNFHREERRRLSAYGWIDRNRGVVQIPIAQAMRDVVRDGIPEWPTGRPAAPAAPTPPR